MSLEFQIQGQDGQSSTVDANYIVSALQQAGFNPQGASADGTTVTLQDDHGPYEVKTQDALQNLGWKVQAATPLDADYENVQPGWRAAVHKLPDDDTRRAYIEGQMRRAGVEKPVITGQGRDWFVFNPQTSQYIAVTNSPDWDKSDLVEAGLEAPRMIASALGGGAGALAGGGAGSIPLAMAGAGAAGAGVDVAERAAIAGMDPVYREVSGQNMGSQGLDVLKGAGMDAATMGLFKGAGPLAGKLFGKTAGAVTQGAMDAAPLSRAAQTVGRSGQAVGGGLKGMAGMADTEFGHDVAAMLVPGASEAQTAGYLMQAPAYLTRGAVKGMGGLGESGLLKQYAPQLAEHLTDLSGRLAKRSAVAATGGETLQKGAESFAQRLGGKAASGAEESLRPSDIMANLFREGRLKAGDVAHDLAGGTKYASPAPAETEGIGEMGLDHLLSNEAAGKRWAGYGRTFGQGIEHLDKLGGGLQRGATGIGRGVIRGARATGSGLNAAGTALRAGGTITQPLESRALLRYGAEEAYGKDLEDKIQASRRRRARSATMDEVLAYK